MSSLVLRHVDLDGHVVDVIIEGGRVTGVGRDVRRPARSTIELDGRGGALVAGLHDHHLHLLALAAHQRSLHLGPPNVRVPADLDRAVRAEHGRLDDGAWIRAVEYEEEYAGALDRARLDALAPGRPVRVQHHSGALWVLSTVALDAIGAMNPDVAHPDGLELDPTGQPTGRLWRLDDWLRGRLPPAPPPDLASVGARLAAQGIIGVTDATPVTDPDRFELLAAAVRDGSLPLSVTVMSDVRLRHHVPPAPLLSGPVKIVIADHDLPDPDGVAASIAEAHAAGRPVAIHCVTRAAVVIAIAAWHVAGSRAGDRVEHASVADRHIRRELAQLGVRVVTQPIFVGDRGDHYLDHVDAHDVADLYPYRSLLDVGVLVGASSDAPHGDPNPWRAIAVAGRRRTSSGRLLGIDESIDAPTALAGYLAEPHDPGGRVRRVTEGARASLCLLDRPLAAAFNSPGDVEVVLTMHEGRVTHARPGWDSSREGSGSTVPR
jgi:predicted amidohydrolase YtcJ